MKIPLQQYPAITYTSPVGSLYVFVLIDVIVGLDDGLTLLLSLLLLYANGYDL